MPKPKLGLAAAAGGSGLDQDPAIGFLKSNLGGWE